MTNHIELDAAAAYETLRAGGLVLLPTDVGYGLVAMEEEAVKRLYELKGRPSSKPCVTVANRTIFTNLVRPVDSDVQTWISKMSAESPIAIIADLDRSSRLLASMSPFVREQATHKDSIATFHSAGPIVERIAELALADGRVVMGSSANLSGTGNNYEFSSVPDSMRSGVSLAMDRGPAWYANGDKLASTILDLRTGNFQREGINFARISRSWREHQRLTAVA